MTLEEVEKEWYDDSRLFQNTGNLDSLSLRIPELHHKYSKILNASKLEQIKLDSNRNEIHTILDQYYSGTLPYSEYEKYSLPTLQKKYMKSEVDGMVMKNKTYIKMTLSLGEVNQKIEYVKDILRMIHQCAFHIKNAIEDRKFKNGQ